MYLICIIEKICQFPGCEKSCYSDRGQTHDFCSKSHADLYNADMYKPHHNQGILTYDHFIYLTFTYYSKATKREPSTSTVTYRTNIFL